MTFEERYEMVRTLEAEGKAIRPAIAELPKWSEILKWIVAAQNAGASRGHVYLRSDTPPALIKDLSNTYIACSNSECNDKFQAIRKHRNARLWSIHVSGPDQAHNHCHHCKETKLKTEWLYIVSEQAGRSPRMKRACDNARQRVFDLR